MGQSLSSQIASELKEEAELEPQSMSEYISHAKTKSTVRYDISCQVKWQHFASKDDKSPSDCGPEKMLNETTCFLIPGKVVYSLASEKNTPHEFLLYGVDLSSVTLQIKYEPSHTSVSLVPEKKGGEGLTCIIKDIEKAQAFFHALDVEKNRLYWVLEPDQKEISLALKRRALHVFSKFRGKPHPLRYAYFASLESNGSNPKSGGPFDLVRSLYTCYRSFVPMAGSHTTGASTATTSNIQTSAASNEAYAADMKVFFLILEICCTNSALRAFLLTFNFHPNMLHDAVGDNFFPSKQEPSAAFLLLAIRKHFESNSLLATTFLRSVSHPFVKQGNSVAFDDKECEWYMANKDCFAFLHPLDFPQLKRFVETNGTWLLGPITRSFAQAGHVDSFCFALSLIPRDSSNQMGLFSMTEILSNIFHHSFETVEMQKKLLSIFGEKGVIDDVLLQTYVSRSISEKKLFQTATVLEDLFLDGQSDAPLVQSPSSSSSVASNAASIPVVPTADKFNKGLNKILLPKIDNPGLAVLHPLMEAYDKSLLNPDTEAARFMLEVSFRLGWFTASKASSEFSSVRTLSYWLKEERDNMNKCKEELMKCDSTLKRENAEMEASHRSVQEATQQQAKAKQDEQTAHQAFETLRLSAQARAQQSGPSASIDIPLEQAQALHHERMKETAAAENRVKTQEQDLQRRITMMQQLVGSRASVQIAFEKAVSNRIRRRFFLQLLKTSKFLPFFSEVVYTNAKNFLPDAEKAKLLKEADIAQMQEDQKAPPAPSAPPMMGPPSSQQQAFMSKPLYPSFSSGSATSNTNIGAGAGASTYYSSSTTTTTSSNNNASFDARAAQFAPTGPSWQSHVPPTARSASTIVTAIPSGAWNKRSWTQLFQALYGMLTTCMLADPKAVVDFLSYPGLEREFFDIYFSPTGDLRPLVIPFLVKEFKINKLFESKAISGVIFSRTYHFSQSVLDALAMSAEGVDDALFVDIVEVSLKLQQQGELRNAVQRTMQLCKDGGAITDQLGHFLKAVLRRAEKEFLGANGQPNGTSLETLQQCADYANNALQVLSDIKAGPPHAQLKSMFDHYRYKMSSDAWLSLFRSAETVAVIIKYLNREDLPLARTKFEEANPHSTLVLSLLKDAYKSYPSPFVTTETMDMTTAGTDSSDRVISKVKSLITSSSTLETRTLVAIFVAWMQKCNEANGVPIAPRNSQVLTALICAHWLARRLNSPSSSNILKTKKAFIGQVGTGEGKSLIIAMLAVYAIKVLNMDQVFVLEHDKGLLKRDHGDFETFYHNQGITSAPMLDTFEGTQMVHTSPRPNVIYCIRPALEGLFQESTFLGQKLLANSLLIVDEVDSLIVDQDPNSNYVKEDRDSAHLSQSFNLLQSNVTTKPRDIPEGVWKFAVSGYNNGKMLPQNVPNGWGTNGTSYYLLDERGNRCNKTSPQLQFIIFRNNGSPTYDTFYFVQNVPHMFSRFSGIVGLSGSLGSPNEKKSLEKVFGAEFFISPAFLDTCKDTGRNLPVLVGPYGNSTVAVFDPAFHAVEIANYACLMNQKVPVVVICKDVTTAEQVFAAIARRVGRHFLSLDLVQRFYTVNNVAPNDVDIARMATQPLKLACDNTLADATKPVANTIWRITVTDYTGGRGIDYRINNRDVNDNGGLLVIATEIATSEREWIQWKGRTARNDRRGQYAVLLSAVDAPVDEGLKKESTKQLLLPRNSYAVHTPPHVSLYKESVIAELLVIRDEGVNTKLREREIQVKEGRWLNELCEKFYARHNGMVGSWPSNQAQEALRDFLHSVLSSRQALSYDAITRFASQVGLFNASGTYVSEYGP